MMMVAKKNRLNEMQLKTADNVNQDLKLLVLSIPSLASLFPEIEINYSEWDTDFRSAKLFFDQQN